MAKWIQRNSMRMDACVRVSRFLPFFFRPLFQFCSCGSQHTYTMIVAHWIGNRKTVSRTESNQLVPRQRKSAERERERASSSKNIKCQLKWHYNIRTLGDKWRAVRSVEEMVSLLFFHPRFFLHMIFCVCGYLMLRMRMRMHSIIFCSFIWFAFDAPTLSVSTWGALK